MAHLEGLEEQLGKQRQEHHTVIYSLERKAVLDNDRSMPLFKKPFVHCMIWS